ncbi:hypothetical protein [Kitasatospora griseola]|uniref:hypothetical protein n=1 Tax=Kitasatospora griseola TaxID=2064 RepID=UPI0038202447
MRLRSRLLGAVTASLGILVGTAVTAVPAEATVCTTINCGIVRNYSKAVMHTTVGLGNSDAPGRCDVWNYGGGTARQWVNAKCDQIALSLGGSRGGPATGDDIDAFTFNGTSYDLRMYSENAPLQTWGKGVWTKIRSDETAQCTQPAGRPYCFITDRSPL